MKYPRIRIGNLTSTPYTWLVCDEWPLNPNVAEPSSGNGYSAAYMIGESIVQHVAARLAVCWNELLDFAKPELLGEALCQIDVLLMDLAYIREHGMSQDAWANVTANALNIADCIKAMKGGAA